ncbi:hypothetical protein [Pseudomonas farris]
MNMKSDPVVIVIAARMLIRFAQEHPPHTQLCWSKKTAPSGLSTLNRPETLNAINWTHSPQAPRFLADY